MSGIEWSQAGGGNTRPARAGQASLNETGQYMPRKKRTTQHNKIKFGSKVQDTENQKKYNGLLFLIFSVLFFSRVATKATARVILTFFFD